jgi:hypothetical protein
VPDASPQDLTPVFELGPLLGRGAFGAVHRARERSTGREVALKLLLTDSSALAFERFLREAAVAATLDHPGIVRVHASGLFSGRPCIVYELVDGAPLGEVVARVDLRRRVELVRDAALAVGHAHAHGVVHRDLKPDNLLVDGAGRVRVTDFGLALLEGADRLTRTGALAGTPTHMAPEQFAGKGERTGPQADVWALGVVLYEALTGRLPFTGENLVALASAIEAGRLAAPRSIDPSISRALEGVCLRALSRDPAARPADGTALARALEQALEGRGGASRRGVAAGLALVAVVALALALALRSAPETSPATSPVVVVTERPVAPTPPVADVPRAATTTPAPAPVDLRLATEETVKGRWALFVAGDRVLTGGPTDDVRLWSSVGEEVRRWSLRTSTALRRTPGSVLVQTMQGELYEVEVDLAVARRGQLLGRVGGLAGATPPGPLAVIRGDLIELRDASGAQVLDEVTCERANEVALSAQGTVLAVSTDVGEEGAASPSTPLHLWDVDGAGKATRPRSVAIPGKAKAVVFAPDGQWLFAGTTAQQIVAIDLARGQVAHAFAARDNTVATFAHDAPVHLLAISADGRRLYSASPRPDELELKAWDVATHAEVGTALTLRGEPRTIDVSPDGARLAIGTLGAGVHVRRSREAP